MQRRRRNSLRLKGYDYSQVGFYFITVGCQNRVSRFGHIRKGIVALNEAGCMVWHWYYKLEEKFPTLRCHEMIVMPNHGHFILEIVEKAEGCSIPRALQWFKTMTTNHYIRGVTSEGWEPFEKRLWQRNYYDVIIRDELAFRNISDYIRTNPSRDWR